MKAKDALDPKVTKTLYVRQIDTPFGLMTAACSNKGVCLLEYSDSHMLAKEINRLIKQWNAEFIEVEHTHLQALEQQLKQYFQGTRREFQLSLDVQGTEFQKKTWQTLMLVPYGETWSYGQQAAAMGNPKAVRAVGHTNGLNPVGIIVPCHRIIGANGKLTGYAGGIERKAQLLALEQKYR